MKAWMWIAAFFALTIALVISWAVVKSSENVKAGAAEAGAAAGQAASKQLVQSVVTGVAGIFGGSSTT